MCGDYSSHHFRLHARRTFLGDKVMTTLELCKILKDKFGILEQYCCDIVQRLKVELDMYSPDHRHLYFVWGRCIMRNLSLGDWILTIICNLFEAMWPRWKKIIFLLVLTFIYILVVSGSFNQAIEWVKLMWSIIDIATITPAKLIVRKILMDIIW